jgi:hypothetical protein
MDTSVCWTGQDYNSVENCRILSAATGNHINGIIDGRFENNPFHVAYFIKTNKNWETISFNINSDIAGKSFNQYFESNRQGDWTSNGIPAAEFDGCIEIDISLTPFTNTLPINRLRLAKKERRRISVVYVDVLKQQTRRIDQFYTRLSDTTYKYENASNNFKSVITVDDAGLVIAYPDHFMRTAVQ